MSENIGTRTSGAAGGLGLAGSGGSGSAGAVQGAAGALAAPPNQQLFSPMLIPGQLTKKLEEKEEVKLDNTIGLMWDWGVGWLWDMYVSLWGPEVIQKAFEMCKKMDPEFYKGLKADTTDEPALFISSNPIIIEDIEIDLHVLEADFNDESDLPSGVLINKVLGLPQSEPLCKMNLIEEGSTSAVVKEEELGPGKRKWRLNTCYQNFWCHNDEDASDVK
ncbi:hypothetical protein BDQ17DRAFT_1430030 [Cyathus striatus]|nr:hypothetical protein BDQ17DRAFT_1430030 [Cyathus striatus]